VGIVQVKFQAADSEIPILPPKSLIVSSHHLYQVLADIN
jgi:hypothetical protein